jgi:Mrp family chromosome partitioning ATPase
MIAGLDDAAHGVFRALGRLQSSGGKRVLFISALRREGVSTLVRRCADIIALRTPRAAVLVDLDLLRDSQFKHYRQSSAPLQALADGRLKGAAFFRAITMDGRELPDETVRLKMARVGLQKLFVTHVDSAGLTPDVRLQVLNTPDYWDALRAGADIGLVDAPALERSRVGLTVAHHMDGVVIVASAAQGAVNPTLALKDELDARGANVLGVIYTHANEGAHRIERWLSRFA